MAALTDRQFVNVIDHENVTTVETRITPFAPEAPRILDCDRPLIFTGIGEIVRPRVRDACAQAAPGARLKTCLKRVVLRVGPVRVVVQIAHQRV